MLNLKIIGPCDSAATPIWQIDKATIVRMGDEDEFRTLFARPSGLNWMPGTIFAICNVGQVSVLGQKFNVSAAPSSEIDDPLEIVGLIASGQLQLMLLEMDPTKVALTFADAHCVQMARDINLNTDSKNPVSGLFSQAGITQLQQTSNRGSSGGENLVGSASIGADGITLYGTKDLVSGINEFSVTCPFLITPSEVQPGLEIRIAYERLTSGEQKAQLQTAQQFADALNLVNLPKTSVKPVWATLDVQPSQNSPSFKWTLTGVPAVESLIWLSHFALSLADQPDDATSSGRTEGRYLVTPTISVLQGSNNVVVTFGAKASSAEVIYAFDGQTETLHFAVQGCLYNSQEADRILRPLQAASVTDNDLLFGCMPFDRGWMEVPFLQADPADVTALHPQLPINSIWDGAVSFGNSLPAQRQASPAERSWNVLVSNPEGVFSTFTFDNKITTLQSVAVELHNPSLVLDGFVLLATAAPTAEDSVPTLDNWAAGLTSLRLYYRDVLKEYLTPFQADLDITCQRVTASVARTGNTSLSTTCARIDTLNLKLLPGPKQSPLYKEPFLAWTRHDKEPWVQALPLTSSKTPPSKGSHSRQYAPLQMDLSPGISFTQKYSGIFPALDNFDGTSGLSPVQGYKPWVDSGSPETDHEAHSLPMVSLGLPGAIAAYTKIGLDFPVWPGSRFQYCWGLPYLNQHYAFAKLPALTKLPDPFVPVGGPQPEPNPLCRQTYGDYWTSLDEKSDLAAADREIMFEPLDVAPPGQPAPVNGFWPITSLIEGITISAAADLQPGSGNTTNLVLTDTANQKITISGGSTEGFSGYISSNGKFTSDTTANEIVAGSLAGKQDNNNLSDQRSLTRGRTTTIGNFLSTPLAAGSGRYSLLSTQKPIQIQSSGIGNNVYLEFSGVPFVVANGQNGAFMGAADPNDPAAQDSENDFKRAFSWDMRDIGAKQPQDFIAVFGLEFWPLQLGGATLAPDGSLATISVVGRLQLPIALSNIHAERPDYDSLVSLTFTINGTQLNLTGASRFNSGPDDATWPLAAEDLSKDVAFAPRLSWKDVAVGPSGITIKGGRLRFWMLDVPWTISVPDFDFPQGIVNVLPISGGPAGTFDGKGAIAVQEAKLNFINSSYLLQILFQTGFDPASSGAADPIDHNCPNINLIIDVASRELQRKDCTVRFFDADGQGFEAIQTQDADNPQLSLTDTSVQAVWDSYKAGAQKQLLPGLAISATQHGTDFIAQGGGVANQTFTLTSRTDDLPKITPISRTGMITLPISYGSGLIDQKTPDRAALFSSSNAHLTTTFRFGDAAQNNTPDLLINGCLEVRNLISWPLDWTLSSATDEVSIPMAAGNLRHARHSARLLFYDCSLPDKILTPLSGNTIFTLAKEWSPTLLVEHEILSVDLTSDSPAILSRSRWTIPQMVSFMVPSAFTPTDLGKQTASPFSIDPAGNLSLGSLGQINQGFLNEQFRNLLSQALQSVHGPLLLIDASVPTWLRLEDLSLRAADSSFVTLEELPDANVKGVATQINDFGPTDPLDPAWILLNSPFLGRLQDIGLDTVAVDIQGDPYLVFTHPSGQLSVSHLLASVSPAGVDSVAVPPIARGAGHKYARLEETAIENAFDQLVLQTRETIGDSRGEGVYTVANNVAERASEAAIRGQLNPVRAAFRNNEVPQPISVGCALGSDGAGIAASYLFAQDQSGGDSHYPFLASGLVLAESEVINQYTVKAMDWSTGNLYVGTSEGLFVFDPATGNQVSTWPKAPVGRVRLVSSSGPLVLTGSDGGKVDLWSTAGDHLDTFQAGSGITVCEFFQSATDTFAVIGCLDGNVHRIRINNNLLGDVVDFPRGNSMGPVCSVDWLPNMGFAIAGWADGSAKIFNTAGNNPALQKAFPSSLQGPVNSVQIVVVGGSPIFLAGSTISNQIHTSTQNNDGQSIAIDTLIMQPSGRQLGDIGFSSIASDGKGTLAIAASDRTYLLSVKSANTVSATASDPFVARDVALSADSKLLAVNSSNVMLFNIGNGSVMNQVAIPAPSAVQQPYSTPLFSSTSGAFAFAGDGVSALIYTSDQSGNVTARPAAFPKPDPSTSLFSAALAVPGEVEQPTTKGANFRPSTLALSPMLSLKLTTIDPTTAKPKAYMTDLMVATDQPFSRLISRLWLNDDKKQIDDWAKSSLGSLCPQSSAAYLRSRTIAEDGNGAVLVSESFTLLSSSTGPVSSHLSSPMIPLRPALTNIRFGEPNRQQRIVGDILTSGPWQLQPPEIAIARPYFRNPSQGKSGYSCFYMTSRFYDDADPMSAFTDPFDRVSSFRITWGIAIQDRVTFRKYRPVNQSGGKRKFAGLPENFTAEPLLSLQPRLPNPPSPSFAIESSQSLFLPDRVSYIGTQKRPGGFHNTRAQLLINGRTGTTSEWSYCGPSIPLQFRFPRPADLAPNQALLPNSLNAPSPPMLTCANLSSLQASVRCSSGPFDELQRNIGTGIEESAHIIRMRLIDSNKKPWASVPPDWDGTFYISVELENMGASRTVGWEFSFDLTDGVTTVPLDPPPGNQGAVQTLFLPGSNDKEGWDAFISSQDKLELARFQLRPEVFPGAADAIQAIRNFLSTKARGDLLFIRAHVTLAKLSEIGGNALATLPDIRQLLEFPVRIVSPTAPDLPLEPRFAFFEDPEYNARLSSIAPNAVGYKNDTNPQRFTLAADRTTYNPNSIALVGVQVEANSPANGSVFLTRIRQVLSQLSKTPVTPNPANPDGSFCQLVGGFCRIDFSQVNAALAQQGGLLPGDTMEISYTIPGGNSIAIKVFMVAEQVQPNPDAAYALLRFTENGHMQTECRLFAWSPTPDRVEYLDPSEIFTGQVRRRAVFKWWDTIARTGSSREYAVQKIRQDGATLIPLHPDSVF